MGEQETLQGYTTPSNTQFSVFLDNRCGKLLELLDVFDGYKVRIAAISVVDSADHAVVRLVTTSPDLARRTLSSHDLPFSECDILVVELSHDQTLNKLCTSLLSAELNIHYAYPLMVRPHGQATIALHCDDMYFAGQVLRGKHFTLLGAKDLSFDGDDDNPFDLPEG